MPPDAPGCPRMPPVLWPGCPQDVLGCPQFSGPDAPMTCWPGTSSAGTVLSASCVIFKNPRRHGDEVFVSDVGISPHYSGCLQMPLVFNPGCPPVPVQKRREPTDGQGFLLIFKIRTSASLVALAQPGSIPESPRRLVSNPGGRQEPN